MRLIHLEDLFLVSLSSLTFYGLPTCTFNAMIVLKISDCSFMLELEFIDEDMIFHPDSSDYLVLSNSTP